MRVLLLIGSMLVSGAAQAQVDPSFSQCVACHAVKPGQNKIGPSLHKIVGAGKAKVPGTKMFYAGMPDAAKRAKLVAYLKTLK